MKKNWSAKKTNKTGDTDSSAQQEKQRLKRVGTTIKICITICIGNSFLALIQRFRDLQELTLQKETEIAQKTSSVKGSTTTTTLNSDGTMASDEPAENDEEKKKEDEIAGMLTGQAKKLVSWQEYTVNVENQCESM